MVIQSHDFYPPAAGYQQHGYAMYQDGNWAEENAMCWGMQTKPPNPSFATAPTYSANKMVYDSGLAQPQPQDGWQGGMKKPQEGWKSPTHDNPSGGTKMRPYDSEGPCGGKYEAMKGNLGPKVYHDTYAPTPATRVEEVVCYSGNPGYEYPRWPVFDPNPYPQFGPPRAEWISRGV